MLIQDQHNANSGTKDGTKLLKRSVAECGIGRPILIDAQDTIIAGNKTSLVVGDPPEGVEVVETDGDELVVVQRTDLDISTDPKAKKLAILDNRTAQLNLDWNAGELKAVAAQVGSDLIGFSADELDALSFVSSESLDQALDTHQDQVVCSVGPWRFYVSRDEMAAFKADLDLTMAQTGKSAQAVIAERLQL